MHTINHFRLPLELQVIHRNTKSQMVTVCILFNQTEADYSELLGKLNFNSEEMRKMEPFKPLIIKEAINLAKYIHDDQTYFIYDTLEVTPPCKSQNVMIILSDIINVSKAQLDNYPMLLRNNNKVIQNRRKRKIFVNFHIDQMKQLITKNHEIVDMNHKIREEVQRKDLSQKAIETNSIIKDYKNKSVDHLGNKPKFDISINKAKTKNAKDQNITYRELGHNESSNGLMIDKEIPITESKKKTISLDEQFKQWKELKNKLNNSLSNDKDAYIQLSKIEKVLQDNQYVEYLNDPQLLIINESSFVQLKDEHSTKTDNENMYYQSFFDDFNIKKQIEKEFNQMGNIGRHYFHQSINNKECAKEVSNEVDALNRKLNKLEEESDKTKRDIGRLQHGQKENEEKKKTIKNKRKEINKRIKYKQYKDEQDIVKKLKEEQDQLQRLKEEQDKLNKWREEQERLGEEKEHQERLNKLKEQQQRFNLWREEQNKLSKLEEEQEIIERLNFERDKQNKMKDEKEKLDKLNEEQERLDKLKEGYERLNKLKEEQDKLDILKEIQDKLDRLKEEQDKLKKLKAEQDRFNRLQEEQDKLNKLKEEQDKLDILKEEQDRLDRLKEEQAKLNKLKEEQDRLNRLQEEQDKLNKLKAEQDRLNQLKENQDEFNKLKEEKERIYRLKEEQDQFTKLKEVQDTLYKFKEEQDLLKIKQDKLDKLKEEQDILKQLKEEQLEQERLNSLKEEKEKLDRLKEEQKRLKRLKEEQERINRLKEEQERLGSLNEEQEKLNKIKEEQDRLNKIKEEQDRLNKKKKKNTLHKLKREQDRLNQIKKKQNKVKKEEREKLMKIKQEVEEAKLEREKQKALMDELMKEIKNKEEELKKIEERKNKIEQTQKKVKQEQALFEKEKMHYLLQKEKEEKEKQEDKFEMKLKEKEHQLQERKKARFIHKEKKFVQQLNFLKKRAKHLTELENKIKQIENEIDAIKTENEKRIIIQKQNEKEIQKLKDIKEKEERLSELKHRLDEEKELNHVNELKKKEEQIDELKTKLKTLKALNYENEIKEKEEKLKELKLRLDDLDNMENMDDENDYFNKRRKKYINWNITVYNNDKEKDNEYHKTEPSLPNEFTFNFTANLIDNEKELESKKEQEDKHRPLIEKHKNHFERNKHKSNKTDRITNEKYNRKIFSNLPSIDTISKDKNESKIEYSKTVKTMINKSIPNLSKAKKQFALSLPKNNLMILNLFKIFFEELQLKYSFFDENNKNNHSHYPYLTEDKKMRISFSSLALIIKYFYEITTLSFLDPLQKSQMISQFENELLTKQNELYIKKHITPILITNLTRKDIERITKTIISLNDTYIDANKIRQIVWYIIKNSPIALIHPEYLYNFSLYGIEFESEYDYRAIAYQRYVLDKKYKRLNAFDNIFPGEGRKAMMINGIIDPTPIVNIDKWPRSCKDNFYQSPINIAKPFVSEALNLNINFPSPDINDTITLTKDEYKLVLEGNFGSIQHGAHYYEVESIEFHIPSEHTIDNDELRADMEMQIICKDVYDQYAAIAVLFFVGNSSSQFLEVIGFTSNSTKLLDSKSITISNTQFANLNLGTIISNHPNYASYIGSMTSPPCLGKVKWFVLFNDRFSLTANQLQAMKETFGKETAVRGLQPLNGRLIKVI